MPSTRRTVLPPQPSTRHQPFAWSVPISTLAQYAVLGAGALALYGCATPPPGTAKAERNEAGQAALEGMENSVLRDNNPDTPVRAKPPN